ncbi:hypothetical protein EELLY_v1c07780 [Entomoplasma ellychniae]|uniref:Uncharacterized protein n=1 Tax=Entomoplasma ellychniae TaxID=2114 RepID=A0A8E2QYT5_9MOLU|nr:hypothetical protein [Entomoplasma ellychniae]PPE05090.1 hypothetical protein EELLY_v1c07780 [Entomoplasma ellychniae]
MHNFFVIDLSQAIWYEKNNILKIGNKNIQNLSNKENYSVLIFILKILKSGYSISKIELEKNGN